jgi:flavin-dependent dehydrogenase
VTGVEIHPEDVILFTDSGTHSADVVIGAFGLDDSMQRVFEREAGYRPPRPMESCVIKLHPADPRVIDRFRGNIEAFLLPVPGVLFGAIVPKGDHLSIVAAGRRVTTRSLLNFLELPHVKKLLDFDFRVGAPFKGSFPNGPALRFYGDRYVMVGDATGLVRPFKGKGINSAAITGIRAAETIMNEGISREAFRRYAARCRYLAGSVWSGRLAQGLTTLLGRTVGLGPLIRFAASSPDFRKALFGAVAGTEDYKDVLLACFSPRVAFGLARSFLAGVARRFRRQPERQDL